jgi:folate-binding protein YgfZ
MIQHAGEFDRETYRLLVPREGGETLDSRLASLGVLEISRQVYEVLRIEAGIPAPEGELTESFTPLEVGLADAISATKGCYTGQEVIARQITYDKVTQQLVGLRPAGPVNPGDPVLAEGKRAGVVTSAALSPRYGPIALGIVRRPHNAAQTEVEIGEAGARIPAVVVDLPFRASDS